LRKLSHSTIVIEENVYIGEKVTILQGVRIGAGSIIGAGSVVTKSIPKNTIAVGVPAKSIKNFKHNKWVAIEQF
ncbi:MAG TPA: acetyltransferase, partial [Methylophilaceae bacterium]|nr:acetyltransferase [Methylophilaceae bacterium]